MPEIEYGKGTPEAVATKAVKAAETLFLNVSTADWIELVPADKGRLEGVTLYHGTALGGIGQAFYAVSQDTAPQPADEGVLIAPDGVANFRHEAHFPGTGAVYIRKSTASDFNAWAVVY